MSQRIVVVDDSRTVCGVVEWAYHGSGIEVVPALNGSEALALIRKSPPVAIIVSYALPDMEAAAFCAAVRGDAAAGKVPILLLTGGYHPVDTAAVLAAGADDAMRKPFRSSDLLARVQGARERGTARGYSAGSRPVAPPPLRPALAPPPLAGQPPSAPARPAGLVAPPPQVVASPLIAPPPSPPLIAPATPTPLIAPPPAALTGASTSVSASFTAPSTAAHQAAVTASTFGAPSGSPSSGMHRAAAPPSGLRTEEREALLRALQPVVIEQVKGALPAIVREVLPAMLREVLATVMREQLGAKVEEYSKRRVDEYVERELPQAADAAIERYLNRIGEGDPESGES
jgi:twitching motility two-component system response regulator PilH